MCRDKTELGFSLS